MPPRHTKKQLAETQSSQLAEVMGEAIRENHKQAQEAEADKSDGGEELTPPPPSQEGPPPNEPAKPEIKQVQGYTVPLFSMCVMSFSLTGPDDRRRLPAAALRTMRALQEDVQGDCRRSMRTLQIPPSEVLEQHRTAARSPRK